MTSSMLVSLLLMVGVPAYIVVVGLVRRFLGIDVQTSVTFSLLLFILGFITCGLFWMARDTLSQASSSANLGLCIVQSIFFLLGLGTLVYFGNMGRAMVSEMRVCVRIARSAR